MAAKQWIVLFNRGAVEETVEYFVIECGAMDEIRQQFGVMRGDELREVLAFGEKTEGRVERVMRMLEQMWKRRRLVLDRRVQGPAQQ